MSGMDEINDSRSPVRVLLEHFTDTHNYRAKLSSFKVHYQCNEGVIEKSW